MTIESKVYEHWRNDTFNIYRGLCGCCFFSHDQQFVKSEIYIKTVILCIWCTYMTVFLLSNLGGKLGCSDPLHIRHFGILLLAWTREWDIEHRFGELIRIVPAYLARNLTNALESLYICYHWNLTNVLPFESYQRVTSFTLPANSHWTLNNVFALGSYQRTGLGAPYWKITDVFALTSYQVSDHCTMKSYQRVCIGI